MREGPIPYDPDERIFTLDDIARFFLRVRWTLCKAAFLGFLFVFYQTITKEPQYIIEATFKEGVEKSNSSGGIKEFLGGFSGIGGSQPQALVLMKSNQVLRPLAERFGLQATVPHSLGRISNGLRKIRNSLLAERGQLLPEVDWFAFENVHCEEEGGTSYRLRFLDPQNFHVLNAAGEKVADATVGTPVQLPDVCFTCSKVPARLLFRKQYSLNIEPWYNTTQGLKGSLKILSQKANSSIYDLTLFWPDRKLGTAILNGLMEEYRRYLKRDYNQTAAEQMANLEQKQLQVYQKMEHMFDEYAAFLKSTIKEKGFTNFKEELIGYLEPHEKLRAKLYEIDISLARFTQNDPSLFLAEDSLYAHSLAEIISQKQDLKQERDLLELSFQQGALGQGMEKHFEELSALRVQREETEKLLQAMQQTDQWALPSSFSWAQGFQTAADHVDFSGYLGNHLRLLSVREKILQERLSHLGGVPTEFAGIDLKTSRALFTGYLSKLDEAEAAMRHYAHLKEEVQQKDFEMGSLAAVLKDPVSQKLIEQASQISLQLKDEKHHSSKEGERWSEEITLHRKLLSEHLEQLWKVEELNADLIRERIAALQGVSLDCINQQISVLDERLRQSITDHQKTLNEEKKLVLAKMEELRTFASNLPDRWKLENWLKLKTDMGIRIVEVMTELVESKTIGHQLHHVESKPLDLAIAPRFAKKPKLYLLSAIGGFGASFLVFFVLLIRAILKGFPTFSRKLIAMRYPFAGKISAFCDGPEVESLTGPDLETLRRLILFLEETPTKKTVGLIGGVGPDYSHSLAQNLFRMGRQTVVIRCDFNAKFQDSDRPGLLQWLEGPMTDIPVRRGNGFDFIPAGGFSPFSMEALQSSHFKTLLERCKAAYDFVFIWLPSPLDLAEVNALLSLSEKAIVTVAGEQTEQLTPFVDWAYDKNRLTFLSFE